MTVRPSVKLIQLAYLAALLLAISAIAITLSVGQSALYWLLLIPVAIILTAVFKHVLRRSTTLTIQDGRVRYETGILSKSSRVMELAKVQDVRMDQTLTDRLLNIGTISLETAGETSRISITGVDEPRRISDHILELARSSHAH